ncbi:Uncharacterized protein, contains HEPN domain, UPF0332 family [Candidatus Fervidibacteria bacterium JGI MDM2 SSWTFF-3-K9]
MRQGKAEFLERAREFLKVAEMALDSDCHHAAVLCAYAAMFWAAIAALALVGVRREKWTHGGLKDVFRDEFVRRRQVYPDRFVLWLSEAYELRCDAHYELITLPVKKVRRLVVHAKEFVETVAEAMKK